MSTLTIDLPGDLAAATTPEAKRSILAFIEAEFGGGKRLASLDPSRLTQEDETALDEAYQAIEEGRMHRFDPAAAREKARRLLEAA